MHPPIAIANYSTCVSTDPTALVHRADASRQPASAAMPIAARIAVRWALERGHGKQAASRLARELLRLDGYGFESPLDNRDTARAYGSAVDDAFDRAERYRGPQRGFAHPDAQRLDEIELAAAIEEGSHLMDARASQRRALGGAA